MAVTKTLRTAAVAAVVLLAAAGSAEAGPPGKWTQVTGVGADDANPMRPGLARTPDGVLHVSWTRDVGGGGSVMHSAISADAKTVSGPVSIYDNVAGGVNFGSDLVVAPDGTLRAFFTATNVFDNVLATATSANGGASWAVGGPASRSGPAGKDVYTADGISATIGKDGTFYSVWGDSSPDGGGYHVGLDPNQPDGDLPDGLQVETKVGVDSVSGQVVSAWDSLTTGGVELQPLAPAGGPSPLPNSAAFGEITGRIGAPGVFVGYGRGSNPFLADPSVYRVDTGKATRLTKKDGELTALAAAPGGRLWAFWKVDGNSIRATRSNAAATKWGQIVSVKPPKGTNAIYSLVGEASSGPLDLLAHVDRSGGTLASWHRRILPGLGFTAKKNKKGKLVVKVSDAGKTVGGVKVKFKGKGKGNKGSKTTSSSGKVSFALEPGKYKVSVSKKGYASYSKRVRVKK
jgi:Carboxypeptidase regulatory-like domain